MAKKLCIFTILLAIFSGCEGLISSTTSYDDVVDMAYETKIGKNNKSGPGYTFNVPNTSQVKTTSNYSSSVVLSNNKYTLYVNTLKYIEDNGLVVKNANGEYIQAESNSKTSDNLIYEYRKIFIADNPNLTVDENQDNAQGILREFNETEKSEVDFEQYAIKYSSDTTTSSNGGYVGPVTSSEISQQTLVVLQELSNDTFYNELIAVENGYEIVYLIKKYAEEKEVKVVEDISSDNFEYISINDVFSTYVTKNSNDTYSVVTKNDYISISANVQEHTIREAIYTTIVTARSISINEDIVLYYAINPVANTGSSDLFNLNATNEALSNQISSTYSSTFSTSLSETSDATSDINTFKFDSRPLTEEELSELEE
ncbi:MAG: peptidylprolyl isomerase [Bacilli bacterium]